MSQTTLPAAKESRSNVERAYRFAGLSGYSFVQRLMIRSADLAFFTLIGLIGITTRFEVEGWENWEAATGSGRLPIYTFWHDQIFLSTFFWRRRSIVVLTSKSFDGEYIARFIQRFGYGAARGSSTRGGIGAIVEMVRLMRAGCPAAFTIDGPKGPRHEAKPGAILLAKKTGQPVLPFAIIPRKFWRAKSWDRMQVPLPFTRARAIIGQPIDVPPNADETALEAKRVELQNSLDALVIRGESWRNAR